MSTRGELPLGPMRAILSTGVRGALAAEDYEDFIRRFHRDVARELATFGDVILDEDGTRSLGMMLGRAIWGATPTPRNNYRPKSLPAPGRNDRCVCGSGMKYKHCCGGGPPPIRLESAQLWPFVLEELPAKARNELLASRTVPIESLVMAASDAAEAGRLKLGVSMLEPLFEPEIGGSNDVYDSALTLLCNLYDSLGFTRKKLSILARVIANVPRSPLRSGAYQRLAAIAIDDGDVEGAWEAFRRAQTDDPTSPMIGILEIQLLLAENRVELARERANILRRQLQREQIEGAENAISFLTEVIEDPFGAVADVGMQSEGGKGLRLRDILVDIDKRPLPSYRFTAEQDAEMQESWHCLVPPDELRTLEADWHSIYPLGKPFSVQPVPDTDADPWELHVEDAWSEFLARHPDAFDSLDILDDLITAVELHPASDFLGMRESLQEPLIRRAEKIICRAIDSSDTPRQISLPWMDPANRPILRCLLAAYDLAEADGDSQRSRELVELLLRINPSDNHGLRAEFMNGLLRDGENERALDLADGYPDDVLAELVYGRVLALIRLGRARDAIAAAQIAADRLPEVRRFLVQSRIRQPELSPYGITLGGKDQAWLYRQAMRQQWLETPGALALLKKTRGRQTKKT